MPDLIANGESGSSVRAKLNALVSTQAKVNAGTIAANDVSSGIMLLGDSTGFNSYGWLRLLATDLAAKKTAMRVAYNVFADASTDYTSQEIVQAGVSGERSVRVTGTRGRFLFSPDVGDWTDDLDVRVKVSLDVWVPTVAGRSLAARKGANAGNWCWNMYVGTNGKLNIETFSDGTAGVNTASTSALGFADGSINWLRFTYVKSTGVVTLYKSTDGYTWTSIGSAASGNTGGIYKLASTNYEIGGCGSLPSSGGAGANTVMTGNIYAVEIRDGVDGKVLNPGNIECWMEQDADGTSLAGTATLEFWNGSIPGATVDYLSDTARLPKLVRNIQPCTVFLSCGHNDTAQSDATYFAKWDTWLTALRARMPLASIRVVTQNPVLAPALFIEAQGKRQRRLLAWAARNNLPVDDVYTAFLADPRGLAALLNVDGRHPNDDGYALWKSVVVKAFNGG